MIGEYSVSEQTNDFAQIYLGTDSYIATTLYATSFQVGAILTTMPLYKMLSQPQHGLETRVII